VAAEKQERKEEAKANIEAKKNAYTPVQLADEYFTKKIYYTAGSSQYFGIENQAGHQAQYWQDSR
jgi:hypothetical protein